MEQIFIWSANSSETTFHDKFRDLFDIPDCILHGSVTAPNHRAEANDGRIGADAREETEWGEIVNTVSTDGRHECNWSGNDNARHGFIDIPGLVLAGINDHGKDTPVQNV